jgi:hypothetical protein
MPQSSLVDSQSVSEQANPEPKRLFGRDRWRNRKVSVRARAAVLRAGLVACLLILCAAAPGAASHLGADSIGRAGTPPKHAICSRLTIPVAASMSADVLFRRRDLQYRELELQLLERRYAQLRHRLRHAEVRRRHHRVLDSLLQYQRWLATLHVGGAANGADPATLAPSDLNNDLFGGLEATLSAEATFPLVATGNFASAASGVPSKAEMGALALSGGSIAETSKVTVNADGGVELYFTPSWSFTAKFDGEIKPQPQLYAGSGTLSYAW